MAYVLPPLRSNTDQKALLEGLADGTIDAICSDHQPHELDAKLAPFQQTAPGISALETLLPLSLRLVDEGVLSLNQALQKVTAAPATIIHSDAGKITVGAPADLVLFNPDSLWELDVNKMRSDGRNTPFAGWSFNGVVERTLLAGQTVYTR